MSTQAITEEKKSNKTKRKTRWEIVVRENLCKGCKICVTFCPAKILRLSDDFNEHGYHHVEVIDPNLCLGCKLCEYMCPDFAIFIKEAKK
ncbi:MAG: 4Fe-4S dicluster domain-containing protein [Candidatus Odinarchaeota archaeon]|nr:4Fe-4S dicluster domain-containing protein [Candidatus Odinarchaeota archaeon]